MSRKIAENISDSSDTDEEGMLHILQDEADDDFKPVKSQPGLYYKVRKWLLDCENYNVNAHERTHTHTNTDIHAHMQTHTNS